MRIADATLKAYCNGGESLPLDDPTTTDPRRMTTGMLQIFLSQVVGFGGGGSTKLDGLVTAGGNLQNGTLIRFFTTTDQGGLAEVLVRKAAGTTAESIPWVTRPDDYDGASNACIFKLIAITIDGCPVVWNPDTSGFHRLLGSGGVGAVTLQIEQTKHVLS